MRKSGILAPISSLPSSFAIGTMGKGAYDFVDFLCEAKQGYWQILPINPPGYGNSPYQAHSAFAGNVFFIDPQLLFEKRLLSEEELKGQLCENTGRVDYGVLYGERLSLLKKAASRVDDSDSDYISFCKENEFWLGGFCTYMALKEQNSMRGLFDWQKGLISDSEREKIHKKLQFLFCRQWLSLKSYANSHGVEIIGDLPIYVAHDSADFYSSPKLFLTDERGAPSVVAGCPPDAFSKNGQLWGNPIYDWEKMKSDGYGWWKKRLTLSEKLFDVVRIDHFRGFYEYYSIPFKSSDASKGKWNKGPGMDFVNEIKKSFPNLKIIAEDLGFLNDEVKAFFKKSGFPGMRILQFAFDGEDSIYLPHNLEKNAVVYTGTHDNPTLVQWLCSANKESLCYALNYLSSQNMASAVDAFIRCAFASVCNTAIIPIQDWLKKGEGARMNTPSTVNNNWEYRFFDRELSKRLTEKIKYFTLLYNRYTEVSQ